MSKAIRRSRELGDRDRGRDAPLARVRFLARLLDEQFAIPGTPYRIGIDPLLGLVPGVGDALTTVMSAWIIVSAARLGAPGAVLARMAINVGIDALAGAIPIAGDLFDAGYKANVRNLRLLEIWAARPQSARRTSGALVVAIVAAAVLLVGASVFVAWKLIAWAFAAVQA